MFKVSYVSTHVYRYKVSKTHASTRLWFFTQSYKLSHDIVYFISLSSFTRSIEMADYRVFTDGTLVYRVI